MCLGRPTGAATGSTGYSSYGVTKGSGGGGGGGGGAKFGSSDKCPRCGKSVYIAEKIVGAGSVSTVHSYFQSCVLIKFVSHMISHGIRDAFPAHHARRS